MQLVISTMICCRLGENLYKCRGC